MNRLGLKASRIALILALSSLRLLGGTRLGTQAFASARQQPERLLTESTPDRFASD
jgi:hypothetical protein